MHRAREPAGHEEAWCVIIVIVAMNFDISIGFAVSCARNKNITVFILSFVMN